MNLVVRTTLDKRGIRISIEWSILIITINIENMTSRKMIDKLFFIKFSEIFSLLFLAIKSIWMKNIHIFTELNLAGKLLVGNFSVLLKNIEVIFKVSFDN